VSYTPGASRAVAGIIGVGRSWTVWMISVLSNAAQVCGGNSEVAMPELALDHHQRDTLPGNRYRVSVPQLMWSEAASDTC
jgi:hypothetical protein